MEFGKPNLIGKAIKKLKKRRCSKMNPKAFELYKEIKDYIEIDINGNVIITKIVTSEIKDKILQFIKEFQDTQ